MQRTRYRPDPWRIEEFGVSLSGIAVAAGFLWFLRGDPVLYPLLDTMPTVTASSLLVVLIGAAAAVIAPPPVLTQSVHQGPRVEVADARAA